MDDQRWPETQPIIWQNEERRRSKQIRKEYFKVIPGDGNCIFFFFYLELLGLSSFALQAIQGWKGPLRSCSSKHPATDRLLKAPSPPFDSSLEDFIFSLRKRCFAFSCSVVTKDTCAFWFSLHVSSVLILHLQ